MLHFILWVSNLLFDLAIIRELKQLGTLSKEDDDGIQNVVKKMNLRSFKLNRLYLDPLKCQMQATFPGVEFLRADLSKYQPEVYKSEKSKILKKIHKVALGKLLT